MLIKIVKIIPNLFFKKTEIIAVNNIDKITDVIAELLYDFRVFLTQRFTAS